MASDARHRIVAAEPAIDAPRAAEPRSDAPRSGRTPSSPSARRSGSPCDADPSRSSGPWSRARTTAIGSPIHTIFPPASRYRRSSTVSADTGPRRSRQHVRREHHRARSAVGDPRREESRERVGVERLVADAAEILEREPAARHERPAGRRSSRSTRRAEGSPDSPVDGDDAAVVAPDEQLVARRRPATTTPRRRNRKAPSHDTARRARARTSSPRPAFVVAVPTTSRSPASTGDDSTFEPYGRAPQLPAARDVHGMNEVAIRAADVRLAIAHGGRADDPRRPVTRAPLSLAGREVERVEAIIA